MPRSLPTEWNAIDAHAISPKHSSVLILLLSLLLASAFTSTADGYGGEATFLFGHNSCAEAVTLEPGKAVQSKLEEDELHCYAIELVAGDYVRLAVHGIGTGAPAELWLPSRSPAGGGGEGYPYGAGEVRGSSQVLTAVAVTPGSYRVTVGPLQDGGPPLPYRIEFTELLSADRYAEPLEHARSAPRVEWLHRNVVPIRSLTPEDEDFSDLRALEEVLVDVDVVLLGEATHADAPTMQGKTRLVKFLHQEMGFDVLAFEADFYSMWKLQRLIEEGERAQAIYEAYMPGMYSVREFQPLLEYVEESTAGVRPLELAGLSPHAGWVADRFLDDLEQYLRGIGVELEAEPAYQRAHRMLTEITRSLEGDFLPAGHGMAEPELSAYGQAVTALEEVIHSYRPDDRTASFWIEALNDTPHWLRRLVSFAEIGSSYPSRNPGPDMKNTDWNWCKFQNKDGPMAANLLWLAREYFPGRKIIVWAHTGHLFRNPHTVSPPGLLVLPEQRCVFRYTRLDDFTIMGNEAHAALGERVYALGVISYEGEERAGPINRDQVEELELEELFYLAGHDYAFLDLGSAGEDGAWLHGRLYARASSHQTMRARWPAVLDGFLFIRETRPTERLSDE